MVINVRYGKPKRMASEQSIYVSFGYKPSIVEVIRQLPERYWNAKDKQWELSYDALSFLQENLPNDKFNIIGEPINEKKFGEKVIAKNYEMPKGLKSELYKYQRDDVIECLNFDKYLMLWEQGLGKALGSICVALKRKELRQVKHCLVICGVNTIKYNYQEEIKKHTGLSATVLGSRKGRYGVWNTRGTAEKLEDLKELKDFFIITNIESLRSKEIKEQIKKHIDKGNINMMIVDEIHKCKNPSSQQGKALLLLSKHVKYFLGLTGTVLSNSPLDAYVPLKCTGRESANFTQFKSRYCEFGGFGDYQIVGFKHLDELQNKLDSISVRRLKADVLDLPPKIHTDEYLEMGSKQAKLYSDVLQAIMKDIDNVTLSLDPLGQLIRLRQATADTSILSKSVEESVKMERLEEIVEEVAERGSKAIVFSNWTQVTDIARKRLKKYNPAVITGQIKDRETEKKKFMENEKCKVIICTTAAAGVGITLTAADTVIFLDEPWTAATKEQAEDRAYRIGTKSTVNIITLLCKGTIDEFIHKIVNKKKAMSEAIVDKKFDLKNKKVIQYLLTGEGDLV